MAVLELAAQRVANTMVSEKVDKKLALDPVTIQVIIEIIIDLITLYQNCRKTPQEALVEWKSLSLLERWKLRRVIKRRVDDEEVYNAIGDKIFNGIKNLGVEATELDAVNMFAEGK